MASNGTPQSYLAGLRPPNQSDNSMAQDNTSSGNPNGYVPQLPQQTMPSQYPDNRFIPPSFDPLTGRWSTEGKTYSLPTAYTPNAGGGLPIGPQAQQAPFMPQFGGQPQQGGGATIAPGGSMAQFSNSYGAPPSQGTPQPSPQASIFNAYQQQLQQQNGATATGVGGIGNNNQLANAVNALASNNYIPKFGRGYAGSSNPTDTYMNNPPGTHEVDPPHKNLMFHLPPGTPGGAQPPAPGSQGGGASGFVRPNILGMPSGLMPGIPGFGGDGIPQWQKSIIPDSPHTSGFLNNRNDPYSGNVPPEFIPNFRAMQRMR